jgi:small subunit ribosomal protein S15
MPLKAKKKKKLIKDSQVHEKDTGSPSVQVTLLTEEIKRLTEHLQDHKKDHSARKGLLGKVAQRRDLLKYLQMNKPGEYGEVLELNGLKR